MRIAHCLMAPAVMVTSLVFASGVQEPPPSSAPQGVFDGEILAVLYVEDVEASVAFYTDILGFRFDHYYDHHDGGSVTEWTHDDEPVYAEMWAGPTRFALHDARSDYEQTVGGSIHYFGVRDVEAHHQAVMRRGGEPSDLVVRPWMTMFSVTDPDGHRLFFQTRPEDE